MVQWTDVKRRLITSIATLRFYWEHAQFPPCAPLRTQLASVTPNQVAVQPMQTHGNSDRRCLAQHYRLNITRKVQQHLKGSRR